MEYYIFAEAWKEICRGSAVGHKRIDRFAPVEVSRVRWRALDSMAEPIDFSRLYCSGTRRLDAEGEIADGSGPEPYSANSDCKWLITAPEGKVVHFEFGEFDTEARVDQVLFFDGAGTHERIMAAFSGPALPPELTTWRNRVLVWFVTDGEREGQGWRATVRFRDP